MHTFEVMDNQMLSGKDPVIPGIYYVCGQVAYFSLPEKWIGSCYVSLVFPKIYHTDNLDTPKARMRRSASHIIGDIFGVMIPSVGVALNSYQIGLLSSLVDRMASNTAGALSAVNTELIAIRSMVLQNRLALDTLLVKEGRVCCIHQCCMYVPDEHTVIEVTMET